MKPDGRDTLSGSYLSMEYGPLQRLMCNVHASSGTHMAQRPHYHDFYQIYFVAEGSLTHHTIGGSSRIVGGDCFIVPPYTTHHIELGEEAPLFYSFSFHRAFVPDSVQKSPAVCRLLQELAVGKVSARISLSSGAMYEMNSLMRHALREFEQKQPAWDCALQGLLAAILALVSRAYFPVEPTGVPGSPALISALEFIHANFARPLSVQELAERAFMSPSTFYRSFRALTGKPFRQYLSELRIRQVCLRIRQTNAPLAQIAASCGYWDYSAFVRAFERQMHMKPVQYRRICAGDSEAL